MSKPYSIIGYNPATDDAYVMVNDPRHVGVSSAGMWICRNGRPISRMPYADEASFRQAVEAGQWRFRAA